MESGNDYGEGSVGIPQLDYEDQRPYDLGYTPGDPADQYSYLFAAEHETRLVVRRIGEGLEFGWALECTVGRCTSSTERWNDAKVFEVEIVNDKLPSPYENRRSAESV